MVSLSVPYRPAHSSLMKHILEPVFPKVELILTSNVELDQLIQSYAISHIEKAGSEMDCSMYQYSCMWLASSTF